jgi:hypothetical protein
MLRKTISKYVKENASSKDKLMGKKISFVKNLLLKKLQHKDLDETKLLEEAKKLELSKEKVQSFMLIIEINSF